MSSERDELAQIIANNSTDIHDSHYGDVTASTLTPDEMADAILAAGYRKPRALTTMDDLGTVYAGSIILDADGQTWGIEGSTERFFAIQEGPEETYADGDVMLPATVLHEGTDD